MHKDDKAITKIDMAIIIAAIISLSIQIVMFLLQAIPLPWLQINSTLLSQIGKMTGCFTITFISFGIISHNLFSPTVEEYYHTHMTYPAIGFYKHNYAERVDALIKHADALYSAGKLPATRTSLDPSGKSTHVFSVKNPKINGIEIQIITNTGNRIWIKGTIYGLYPARKSCKGINDKAAKAWMQGFEDFEKYYFTTFANKS